MLFQVKVKNVDILVTMFSIDKNFCLSMICIENSITRVKHPDHLNLWDTVRHILYRRDYLLQRFLSATGNLSIRISMQVEPNDLAILESADSDDWILANED